MKILSDYTDVELFRHGVDVLTQMCESMTKSHASLAGVITDDGTATTMLKHSLRTCLDGVGDILNGIELIDDDLAAQSSHLFRELERRFDPAKAELLGENPMSEPGRPDFSKFPVSVQLCFRSTEEKDRFMGELSDGFGEEFCDLEWPWADAPRGSRGETLGFEEQERFAVTVGSTVTDNDYEDDDDEWYEDPEPRDDGGPY